MAVVDGTVVVIGGLGALGRAITRALVDAGASVVLMGTRRADDPLVTQHLTSLGGGAAYERATSTHTARFTEVFASYSDITAAIYSAGVSYPGSALHATSRQITDTFGVNAVGWVHFVQAAAQRMLSCGTGGSILGISSWAQDVPDPDDVIYGASKAAMTSAMRGFALTLAPHGIRVNTLAVGIVGGEGMAARHMASHPGYAERATRAVPLGRLALPSDVAKAACWLLSAEAAYITGVSLPVDGGSSLRQDAAH